MASKTEETTFAVIALVALILSVAELFGVLDNVGWFKGHISKLTLLLVSMTMLGLCNIRATIGAIESRITSLKLHQLRKTVDPELTRTFGMAIDQIFENVSSIIDKCEVPILDRENLRPYYNQVLLAYPQGRFLATSIASESYFWAPGTFEESIRKFIKHRGRMERIFFIENDHDKISDEERRVLVSHYNLGVIVYAVKLSALGAHRKRLFLVESDGRVGWESHIAHTKEIISSIASVNRERNRNLVNIFHEIKAMDATRTFNGTGFGL